MANNKEWVSEWVKKSEKYTRGKCTKQREEKWKQIYFHTKNISYCILHSLPHTQKYCQLFIIMTLYHPLCYRGMCYIVCYSGKNVITFIISCSSSSPPSFLICAYDDVHLYVGEWRGWNVRRKRREKQPRKEKFSSTSFIFGVAAAMDPSVILYAETVSCSLFFIVHYLWKSINSQNTIFYIELEISFYYILHKSGIIKQMNQFFTTFPPSFHHVALKLALFYSKDEALESERIK